jgi:hypothetical protein
LNKLLKIILLELQNHYSKGFVIFFQEVNTIQFPQRSERLPIVQLGILF